MELLFIYSGLQKETQNTQYLISTHTLSPKSLLKFANKKQSTNFSMLFFNVKRSGPDASSKERGISLKYESRKNTNALNVGIFYTERNSKRTRKLKISLPYWWSRLIKKGLVPQRTSVRLLFWLGCACFPELFTFFTWEFRRHIK